MDADDRTPMPSLEQVLEVSNGLLALHGLETCNVVKPGHLAKTTYPLVFGVGNTIRYVIRVQPRHTPEMDREVIDANYLANHSDLPIPQYFCCSSQKDPLALVIMRWMPGDQLDAAIPNLEPRQWQHLAGDWGACVGEFHSIQTDQGPPHLRLTDSIVAEVKRQKHNLAETIRRALQDLDEHQNWLSVRKRLVSIDSTFFAKGWIHDNLPTIHTYFTELCAQVADLDGPVVLAKPRQGLHDFLCLSGQESRISAMLNWERLHYGDGIQQLVKFYVRFKLWEVEPLWPLFLNGYESKMNVSPSHNALARYYACAETIQSITQGERPDLSVKLLEQMMEGSLSPLEPAAVR